MAGTHYSGNAGDSKKIRKGRERKQPIAKPPQLNIDVPALFFGAIMIVFVLWPAAQWALGLWAGLPHEGAPPL